MAIIDLIVPEVIKVGLTSNDKPSIIRELLQILVDAGKVTDKEAALEALFKRETLQSTGLEAGFAVPHAKTGAVTELTLAIGIAPDGKDFDSMDKEPSKLFFMMLAPPNKSGPHIEALSEIARMSKSRAFRSALAAAKSPEEVIELFSD